jgi:hypothetical protein
MRSRPVAAFVLLVTLAGLIVAFGAAAHSVERPSVHVTDGHATVATAALGDVPLVAPAKVTSSVRDALRLGTSFALVGLLFALQFVNRETVFVRPAARARGTWRHRAPPGVVI